MHWNLFCNNFCIYDRKCEEEIEGGMPRECYYLFVLEKRRTEH